MAKACAHAVFPLPVAPCTRRATGADRPDARMASQAESRWTTDAVSLRVPASVASMRAGRLPRASRGLVLGRRWVVVTRRGERVGTTEMRK